MFALIILNVQEEVATFTSTHPSNIILQSSHPGLSSIQMGSPLRMSAHLHLHLTLSSMKIHDHSTVEHPSFLRLNRYSDFALEMYFALQLSLQLLFKTNSLYDGHLKLNKTALISSKVILVNTSHQLNIFRRISE